MLKLVGPAGATRAFLEFCCSKIPAQRLGFLRTSETRFGKGAARSGFQILLERKGASVVGKCDIALNVPRTVLCSVCDFTRVVFRQPRVQIIRDSGIEMLMILLALQNVDVFHSEVRLRKEASARQPSPCWDFKGRPAGSFWRWPAEPKLANARPASAIQAPARQPSRRCRERRLYAGWPSRSSRM
jgi:hypothetical protein